MLRAPRYGAASLAEVVPSAISALTGVDGASFLPGPRRGVVVMIADGLGSHDLRRHRELAPFLAAHVVTTIDAAFPTTTVTSLATIGTGRPPGEHGLTGYATALPDEDQPFNLLTWRIGKRGGGRDARDEAVPEEVQPTSTAFEGAAAAGVRTTVVLHPDVIGSGLTRAALRGGERVAAAGLETSLSTARDALVEGPALVYVHDGAIDAAGHVRGPGSDAWCEALSELDRAVEQMAADLPTATSLLITADHGMVGVPPEDVLELSGDDDLLAGVRVVSGEPRVRQLFTVPGAAGDVAAVWRDRLGDRAEVVTRDEAVAAGWFGPVVHAWAAARIGDVVAVATRGSVVHGRVDPHGGRHLGQHGALSPAELEVPLIRIDGGSP